MLTKRGVNEVSDTLPWSCETECRLLLKERGVRSEQHSSLPPARTNSSAATVPRQPISQEARIAATLANMAKEVQSLFTLVHTEVALTNSLLQYVLTCTIEPPEDVLPAARARARLRHARILRLAGEEVATRNKATLEQVLNSGKQP